MSLADTLVGIYDFSTLVSDENKRKVVFAAEMWQDGTLVSRSVTPFVANKHLELRRPGLKVQSHVDGKELCVDVSAHSLARFVELSIDGSDAIFSDNYFDVPAGTTVTVSTPLPDNWTADSRIQVRSLYESFA
jgi:beta-mannosidase